MSGQRSEMFRVIFAGGGTGGHLYPGIAMYEQLVEVAGDVNALFVGAKGGMEEMLFGTMDLNYELIPGRGLRGASIVGKLTTPFVFAGAVRRAISITRRFRPDVVVGTGGYASAATVVAAIILGIPRVLQEQNSIPGLVNRRLSRFADLVLASFESSKRYFSPNVPCEIIGNPYRLLATRSRATACEELGLEPGLKTVLVIGGSRGAHSLNVAGADAIKEIRETQDIQAVLLTGEDDYEAIQRQFEGHEARVKVISYMDDPGAAYAAADVAVARAGASVVFELCSFGVPTIFVPYPWAADNHQALNAAELVEAKAAVVIADERLSGSLLATQLLEFLSDTNRLAQMSEAMKRWARPDAARAAANHIVQVVKKKSADDVPETVALGY